MHRRTLIIGVALASLWHVSSAHAQAEDLEVTMNVVLDEAADVERVVLRIIEEEASRSAAGPESLRNAQLETQRRDREGLPPPDSADPDVIDDGLFDDYDDGEAIEPDIDGGT